MLKIFIFLNIFISSLCASENNKLNVAVSSNFLLTFKIIAFNFEQISICKLNICSDSTAILYNKIINNAPFDVFISADAKHPVFLEKNNINKSYIYGYGSLIFFGKKNKIIKNFLRKKENFYNIVVANKNLSPYGVSTMYVLKNLKIKFINIINGLNITQTYNFIYNNSSYCGFFALSQALHSQIQSSLFFLLPVYLYPKIEQRFIFLKDKHENFCLNLFFEYLNTDSVKKIIYKYGYRLK